MSEAVEIEGIKLRNCLELQSVTDSLDRERQELSNLGITLSSSLAVSIVHLALTDFIVAVHEKTKEVFLATASVAKLKELFTYNCVIPKHNDFNAELQLLNKLTIENLINYLKEGRYYFVKVVPTTDKGSLMLCTLSSFNPYPDFSEYDLYSLEEYSRWYSVINSSLSKGFLEIKWGSGNISVCSLATTGKGIDGKLLNFRPRNRSTTFVLNVVDISGALVTIPVFDIHKISNYYSSDLERDVLVGVIQVGSTYYTANRGILEGYYGDVLYSLESLKVRQRWALEDMLYDDSLSLDYIFKKYNFYTEKSMSKFSDRVDFRDYLYNMLSNDSKTAGIQKVTLRALVNPDVIYSNKVSYYRSISLGTTVKYRVLDVADVLPKNYLFSAVSKSFGYKTIQMRLQKGFSIKDNCAKEFTRQFGSIVEEKGIYSISESVNKAPYPVSMSTDIQLLLAEKLNAGNYVSNFDEYFSLIRDILEQNKAKYIDRLSVKYMFINSLVKELKRKTGKGYICDLAILGSVLSDYVVYCRDTSKEEHCNKMLSVLSRLKTNKDVIVTAVNDMLTYSKIIYQKVSICSEDMFALKVQYSSNRDKGTLELSTYDMSFTKLLTWKREKTGIIIIDEVAIN